MPWLNVATPEKPPFSASKWTAKKIPTRERLIFALDTTDFGEAKRIVEMLGDQVHFYKIGLQLFMTGHYLAVGCEGVISSGLEVKDLRREFGDAFIIVVPGIRPIENKDDHKRTVDVEEAFDSGADYIVVGRPIARADDPAKAAESIQKRISAIFEA